MDALSLLVLIMGPSSESRCLCTYKEVDDAHAYDASKYTTRFNDTIDQCKEHSRNTTRLLCSSSELVWLILQQHHLIERQCWQPPCQVAPDGSSMQSSISADGALRGRPIRIALVAQARRSRGDERYRTERKAG